MFPSIRIGAPAGVTVPSGCIKILLSVACPLMDLTKKTKEDKTRRTAKSVRVFLKVFFIVSSSLKFYSSQLRDSKTVFPATLTFKQPFSGHISTHRKHIMQAESFTFPPFSL